MNKKKVAACSLASIMFAASAVAETLSPGTSLSGYQCYSIDVQKLGMTREDAWLGRGLPPVFDAPRPDAKLIGVSPSLVYVAWPLENENGFVRVVRGTGRLGWISEDVIRPLYRTPGSAGGCSLSWRGDRIQVRLDPGAKAWLWPDNDLPGGQ